MAKKWKALDSIPEHLSPYIVQQDTAQYSAMDHAAWRFILLIARDFFKTHAHPKYLEGLNETGISLDRIPSIQEMDRCLQDHGWRAVAVSGFIPPAVFMEFQSLGILPIACDMRKPENLDYTPSPDIIHEAAGHAPILSDPEYTNYLRSYGEVSRKAIVHEDDINVYKAIRLLSDTKENPHSTQKEIADAQRKLDEALAEVKEISEAAYLSRMNWWTAEYGLVGTMESPKIYGAGLLSSLGESFHCLDSSVKKIPFSLDCIQYSYDITKPQPQLFVTPDFPTLTEVLHEFESAMAFRQAGHLGLQNLLKAKTVNSITLDSGLQISGKLVNVRYDSSREPVFLKFEGPTQLSYENRELDGHGTTTHATGFSFALGCSPSTAQEADAMGFRMGQSVRFRFPSGIILTGIVAGRLEKEMRPILIRFLDCTLLQGDEVLYRPEWGVFDLALGSKIVGVFGGAADRASFIDAVGLYIEKPPTQGMNLDTYNSELQAEYLRVRQVRNSIANLKSPLPKPMETLLEEVFEKCQKKHPQSWLIRWEILEILKRHGDKSPLSAKVLNSLEEHSRKIPSQRESISRGIQQLG